jgi:hypothetical protein
MRSLSLLATAVSLVATACVAEVADSENPGEIDISPDVSTRNVERITTISYAPNSFVIGNAYGGWTDLVQGNAQFSAGPGNEGGAGYRWGYLFGEDFDRCAWINTNDVKDNGNQDPRCGDAQQIDTPLFMSTFSNGEHNSLAGDGSVTHMHYTGSGCSDTHGYGNVEPWRVPATPNNDIGEVPDGKELLWRYVSRGGGWVMVRDPAPPANQPNWYFVQRGCISLANTD